MPKEASYCEDDAPILRKTEKQKGNAAEARCISDAKCNAQNLQRQFAQPQQNGSRQDGSTAPNGFCIANMQKMTTEAHKVKTNTPLNMQKGRNHRRKNRLQNSRTKKERGAGRWL